MNIIKTFSIIIFTTLITSCSITPWQTTKFISLPVERFAELKNVSENDFLDSDCIIGDVFFYFVTNGVEDTMYGTKGPFAINFVFESFKKGVQLKLNSIVLDLDGTKIKLDEKKFPVDVLIDFPGYINPNLYSESYMTEYLYDLRKIKNILVTVNVTLIENGIETTKDLKAGATKKIRRGIVQYRY